VVDIVPPRRRDLLLPLRRHTPSLVLRRRHLPQHLLSVARSLLLARTTRPHVRNKAVVRSTRSTSPGATTQPHATNLQLLPQRHTLSSSATHAELLTPGRTDTRSAPEHHGRPRTGRHTARRPRRAATTYSHREHSSEPASPQSARSPLCQATAASPAAHTAGQCVTHLCGASCACHTAALQACTSQTRPTALSSTGRLTKADSALHISTNRHTARSFAHRSHRRAPPVRLPARSPAI
jgi:hypothetical protein